MNVKGRNSHRICVGLRVKSHGGHFAFYWQEFLSMCVVEVFEKL